MWINEEIIWFLSIKISKYDMIDRHRKIIWIIQQLGHTLSMLFGTMENTPWFNARRPLVWWVTCTPLTPYSRLVHDMCISGIIGMEVIDTCCSARSTMRAADGVFYSQNYWRALGCIQPQTWNVFMLLLSNIQQLY